METIHTALEWLRDNKDSLLALAPFVAALAGFFGVYWAQRITVKARREEALSAWWEERAITQTIEPINAHLENALYSLGQHIGVKTPSELEMPLVCFRYLKRLTGITEMEYLIMLSKWAVDYGVSDAHILLINHVLEEVMLKMHELEGELLGIRISDKKDIMSISQKPEIQKHSRDIDRIISEMGHIPFKNVPPEITEKAKILSSIGNYKSS